MKVNRPRYDEEKNHARARGEKGSIHACMCRLGLKRPHVTIEERKMAHKRNKKALLIHIQLFQFVTFFYCYSQGTKGRENLLSSKTNPFLTTITPRTVMRTCLDKICIGCLSGPSSRPQIQRAHNLPSIHISVNNRLDKLVTCLALLGMNDRLVLVVTADQYPDTD